MKGKFFKITKWNIILTVFIGLFTLLSLFLSGRVGRMCELACQYSSIENILWNFFLFLGWPFYPINSIGGQIFGPRLSQIEDITLGIIALGVTIIWVYFLSCLIFYLINKVRK